MLGKIAKFADKTNEYLGNIVSVFSIIMVIMMVFSVVQRYVFQSNHIWQHELIIFLHAAAFLTAAGYTLKKDEHVRVDVFYERLSSKNKAFIILFGCVFLLIPVCLALLFFSFDFIANSWQIFEKSRENDGLHGVFILKSFIWIFCITLILQAISIIHDSLNKIKQ